MILYAIKQKSHRTFSLSILSMYTMQLKVFNNFYTPHSFTYFLSLSLLQAKKKMHRHNKFVHWDALIKMKSCIKLLEVDWHIYVEFLFIHNLGVYVCVCTFFPSILLFAFFSRHRQTNHQFYISIISPLNVGFNLRFTYLMCLVQKYPNKKKFQTTAIPIKNVLLSLILLIFSFNDWICSNKNC